MTGLVVNFVSKVVRHRGLIRSMVQRDLKSRYVGSVMGLFWSVIHPLVLLVSYTFVFSVILRIPSPPGFPNPGTAALPFTCSAAFFPG